MKISRLVADLGNSQSQFLIDGNYFEMPSSVKIISEQEARGSFAENVEQDMLLKELVLRVSFNNETKYVKVGTKAEADALGNAHIEKLHDKTSSPNSFILWASAIAYYHAMKAPDITEDGVTIHSNYTMIPIWLVKQADKFSTKIQAMAQRFYIPVEIELLTQGYERVLKVKVTESKARIEGETSRFALKFGLDLKLQENAKQFENAYVVVDDLGGQTQDLCKLQKGLRKPASSDDFQSVTDLPFLKYLETLRKEKLMAHFTDIRSFEQFIKENALGRKYIFTETITWVETDLTPIIEPSLMHYAEVVVEKCLLTFAGSFKSGDEVYFVHCGGVIEVLKPYIQEYLVKRLGLKVAQERHIFPQEGRKLNLYGCEIVAKDEALKQEKQGAVKQGVRSNEKAKEATI